MPSEIGGGSEQMPVLCRPFWWPWWGVEAIHAASPDATCPGLHRKPLDAAIGWLLALYRLGGRQGDSKQNNDVSCTHFDGHFGGHRDGSVGQVALASSSSAARLGSECFIIFSLFFCEFFVCFCFFIRTQIIHIKTKRSYNSYESPGN